jgi:hypothetical protein
VAIHYSTNAARGEQTSDSSVADYPFELALSLVVRDRDTIEALCQYDEGFERDEFALSALRIGVLALRHVRGQVDADLVRREGDQLLAGLKSHLGHHAQTIQDRLASLLREYFDPDSGRFPERVQQLVRRDGELEQLLRRQIGGEESELARTLVQHVGLESPLWRMLDPQESQGLLAVLRGTVEEELKTQRERVLAEFSLDNKVGALSRFIDELTGTQDKLHETLQRRIDSVVKEFSLDEESSALSRLVQNVDRAQRTITSEFSLDNENSALSRIREMLQGTQEVIHGNLSLDNDQSALSRLRRELLQLVVEHDKRNREFQEEVKVTLGKMAARREEAARGTRHGILFEDAVAELIQREAEGQGHIVDRTGNRTGQIQFCKKGDCVIEIGPDYPAAGTRIVVEAKEAMGFDLAKAREEIAEARKNRDAQLGLFVFSKATAGPAVLDSLERPKRLGPDLFLVWDAEDPATDLFLQAALTIAFAVCLKRPGRSAQACEQDMDAIQKAILEIERQCESLTRIGKASESINSSSEKITKEVNKAQTALRRQIGVLQDRVGAVSRSLGPPARDD